ncbi:MAG: S-methyl-5-thioribose-1-phosphate isomerase [Kiritimatiellae bacterium]|nr:S-methyl-5-thioribose-1-phosphate isomerase [Kiritimatiellia bacterium]
MYRLKTIEWVPERPPGLVPGRVRFVDQTLLPTKLSFVETSSIEDIRQAILTLQVRGAPAIGIAAAMGLVLAAQASQASDGVALLAELQEASDELAATRPTAINLVWALRRMKRCLEQNFTLPIAQLKERLAREAVAIRDEDAAMCRAIGRHGVALLKDGSTILTHCNAGGLAAAEYGTALAPIYTAVEQGMKIRVIADETRPLLQGSRLTAWELQQAGIPVTVICDNMAAHVMKLGWVDMVFVGADRIAANGDTANKIGTYGLAVVARAHKIPFYVFAPTSTFDPQIPTGDMIPIEERPADEVVRGFGRQTAPDSVLVYSPAFDVTPARLITAIVSEKGIATPPFKKSLRRMLENREQGNLRKEVAD